ncbi:MAG: hypothetical protein ACR2QX_06130 [Woeseiaceae bacterium]
MLKKVTFLLVIVLAFSATFASKSDIQIAFRGSDGEYTKESRRSLKSMAHAAKKEGSIEIWITFEMAYVGDPAQRTADVIQSESQEKEWLTSLTLGDAIAAGHAEILPTPFGLEQAPGCMVSVTETGLELLLGQQKVKHISYTEADSSP